MAVRGYSAIGLYMPKTHSNVGGVLRVAYCYGAAIVAITGQRFESHATDTPKTWKSIPLLQTDDLKKVVPYDCVPVAVEIIPGARLLMDYTHPPRAFYVFGPEDGTLGKEVLSWCRDVVSVPTNICMNLAVCAAVVLYDRMLKARATT